MPILMPRTRFASSLDTKLSHGLPQLYINIFTATNLAFYDSFSWTVDTTSAMSRSHVRGILVATAGARRSSTLLMSSKSTGKLASGFVPRLDVTRKVKQENEKLKSISESTQLMSKNLPDCPSLCSRPSSQ